MTAIATGSGEGRLARAFAGRRKVLVTYLCVGDPTVEDSIAVARACVDAGADVLELGVPFSDPTADGPSIARASQRALRGGGGLTATLRATRALRDAGCDAPVVLFGYFNPLFVRGEARVVDEAADAGADGFLVVDLPAGEGAELRARARARGLAVVPLLAPTSSAERVGAVHDELANAVPGTFLYYVSVTGVTGSADAPLADAGRAAADLGARLGVPVVVGFGIDSAAKARAAAYPGGGGGGARAGAAADGAAGVVVGTALVKLVEAGRTTEERAKSAAALVRDLRGALDA